MSFDLAGTYAASAFNFLLGTSTSGFEDNDGLIGLSRPRGTNYNQIVDQLYKASKITNNIFAFYMTDHMLQSSLQIGDYDPAYLKTPADGLTQVPLVGSDLFWKVEVNAFRIGRTEKNAKGQQMGYKMPSTSLGYPDTGTSFLIMPDLIYDSVISLIIGDNDFDSYQTTYVVYCNDTFPSLFL